MSTFLEKYTNEASLVVIYSPKSNLFSKTCKWEPYLEVAIVLLRVDAYILTISDVLALLVQLNIEQNVRTDLEQELVEIFHVHAVHLLVDHLNLVVEHHRVSVNIQVLNDLVQLLELAEEQLQITWDVAPLSFTDHLELLEVSNDRSEV